MSVCGAKDGDGDKPCQRIPGHQGRHTPSRRGALEADELQAKLDTVTHNAVETLAPECPNLKEHQMLTFEEFLKAGGGWCALCLAAKVKKLTAALEFLNYDISVSSVRAPIHDDWRKVIRRALGQEHPLIQARDDAILRARAGTGPNVCKKCVEGREASTHPSFDAAPGRYQHNFEPVVGGAVPR